MDDERTAATAGIVACGLTAVAVAAPYLVLSPQGRGYVGTYYASGPVNPLAVGLLGAVGTVVFASGREARSSPDLVAGVMLSVGAFSLAVTVPWALGFRAPEAGAPAAIEFLRTHRWLVLAGTALEAAAAGWYAAALGLVPVPGDGERR